jgi:uncharacterized membrane protein
MSDAIYSNAALTTAFLTAMVKSAETWRRISFIAITRGLKSAIFGAIAAAVVLSILICFLLPQVLSLELYEQQFLFGTLLVLTGMRWLRKAILRYSAVYTTGTKSLKPDIRKVFVRSKKDNVADFDYLGFFTAFRIGLINCFPIIVIPIALGYPGKAIDEATSGATLGVFLVLASGFSLKKTLTEGRCNRFLFSVGALLSAFGTFWTAEGLGFHWPASALVILIHAFTFWITGWAAIMRKCVDPTYTPITRFRTPMP